MPASTTSTLTSFKISQCIHLFTLCLAANHNQQNILDITTPVLPSIFFIELDAYNYHHRKLNSYNSNRSSSGGGRERVYYRDRSKKQILGMTKTYSNKPAVLKKILPQGHFPLCIQPSS